MSLTRLLAHLKKWDEVKRKPKSTQFFDTEGGMILDTKLAEEFRELAGELYFFLINEKFLESRTTHLEIFSKRIADKAERLFALMMASPNKPQFLRNHRPSAIKQAIANSYLSAIINAMGDLTMEERNAIYKKYYHLTFADKAQADEFYKSHVESGYNPTPLIMNRAKGYQHDFANPQFGAYFKYGQWNESKEIERKKEYEFLLLLEDNLKDPDQTVKEMNMIRHNNKSVSISEAEAAFNEGNFSEQSDFKTTMRYQTASTNLKTYGIKLTDKEMVALTAADLKAASIAFDPRTTSAKTRLLKKTIPIHIYDQLNRGKHAFRLNENELSTTTVRNISDLKCKYQLDFLIQLLHQMKSDYIALGHRSKLSSINKLIYKMEQSQLDSRPNHEKLEAAIKAIRLAFTKEQASFQHRFFTRNRTTEEFIKYMNKSGDDYPHLLRLVLTRANKEIKDFPAINPDSIMGKITGLPKKPLYEKYLSLVSDPQFDSYYQHFKPFNISKLEAYRYYKAINPINVSLIKKLWPSYKKIYVPEKYLEELLRTKNTEAFKKRLSDRFAGTSAEFKDLMQSELSNLFQLLKHIEPPEPPISEAKKSLKQ